MEHEVYLPLSATAVRSAFAEPERVARCVPGLRLEPGGALAGRMRVRIASSTITYGGTLSLSERGEGVTIEAAGAEVRGEGTVRLALTIVPRPVTDRPGCTLSFRGTVEAVGRLADHSAEQRAAAARRLLDRFAEALVEELSEPVVDADEPPPAALAAGIGAPDDNEPAIPVIPAAPEPEPEPERWPAEVADLADAARLDEVDDVHGVDDVDAFDTVDEVDGADGGVEVDELVAAEAALPEPEADFARRTMIGRSAEEVDHAPPRGRYAPDPAPGQPTGPGAVLRWAAPAAAIALASAVIVGRALRRRRGVLR
ncbi:hypothetical protein E1265_24785 [Streptomyces sp. 8K308]|nr:hypothetical protein [Streptomyces sp. 8K308]TDC18817.1 hypothetical protein E1265_24785 [Streptomyces sp. 8K308]